MVHIITEPEPEAEVNDIHDRLASPGSAPARPPAPPPPISSGQVIRASYGPWRVAQDTDSNQPYYYHVDAMGRVSQTTWRSPPTTWRVFLHKDSGAWYYHNLVTEEVTWQRPAALDKISWREAPPLEDM